MINNTLINDRFKQFYLISYQILDALQKKVTISELILNTLFIGLVLIISMIIYWDTINSKVSQTSRCKRQLDIFNKNKGIYIINAFDKLKNKLFSVSYDVNQNNTSLKCECKPGKYINYFNDIPVKNMRTNNDVKENKVCSCDTYYNVGNANENIIYDGDPGILRYMTAKDSDFFDNLIYQSYS